MSAGPLEGQYEGRPLDGWVIVQSQGLTLIGREDPRRNGMLSPVYEFKPMLTGKGVVPLVMPVWLLGINEFSVPQGAIIEPIESFTLEQRALIAKFVEQAAAAQAQARGEGPSRIAVAPAGSEDVVANLLAKARRGA